MKKYFILKVLTVAMLSLSAMPALASNQSLRLDSETKHKKKLDFDNNFVEGLSKQPGSISQISDADRKRKTAHLYQKRSNFAPETSQTLQELRYN